MRSWQKADNNTVAPQGFQAAAAHAGIKPASAALDVALLVSEAEGTTAAGVFTTNRVAAAPVNLSRRFLKASRGHARAVVVNSGNANACTGRLGFHAANRTAAAAAKELGVPIERVLVASTGVIGVQLRADLLIKKMPALVAGLSAHGLPAAARAIMTTDTFPKICAIETVIQGKKVRLAGIAKGAGMIHPHMATMLAFILTDAAITAQHLNRMLRLSVEGSFNRITVDGDTSTNDSVILLASGLSGARVALGTPGGAHFLAGLNEVCQSLARSIVRDGEGAKKLVTIEVRGARSEADADRMARAIGNSPLVKTAIAGSDANWGRILCAAGYSGSVFDPAKVDIFVNELPLCRRGLAADFNEPAVRAELDRPEVTVRIDLHEGRASARIWTCDLTADYIRINASYRT